MAPPPACGLEAKHYILAAFTAGFIAAAVVTIVFVVLSPARINFSVTSASSHDLKDGGVLLSLTISANNTSRRAAVLYRSMYVDVSNDTGLQWMNWVRAETGVPLEPQWGSKTKMNATVTLVGVSGADFTGNKKTKMNATVTLVGVSGADFTGNNKTRHSFSVRVTAVARFKVGVARTRLYDIKVMCAPVDFFANKSTIVPCL